MEYESGYLISHAANALREIGLRVSASTIRKYENLGLVSSRRITAGKQERRLFTEDQFIRLKIVVILKQLGLSNGEVVDWLQRPNTMILQAHMKELTPLVAEARRLVGLLRDSLTTPDEGQVTTPQQAA